MLSALYTVWGSRPGIQFEKDANREDEGSSYENMKEETKCGDLS